MKVRELVEELLRMDPGADVCGEDGELLGGPVTSDDDRELGLRRVYLVAWPT